MKTTLIIPDEIMRDLKKKAVDAGLTLSEIVAQTLTKGMATEKPGKKPRKLSTFSCGRVFVNVADREQLYRAMEGR